MSTKIEVMGWRRIALAGRQPTFAAQQVERDAGAALLQAIGIDPVSGQQSVRERIKAAALSADELEALSEAGVGIAISGRWSSPKPSGDAPQPVEVWFDGARPLAYTVDEVLLGEHAPVWVIPEEGEDVRITLAPASPRRAKSDDDVELCEVCDEPAGPGAAFDFVGAARLG